MIENKLIGVHSLENALLNANYINKHYVTTTDFPEYLKAAL